MYYTSLDAWWWPFVFITLAGVLPTAVWRWLGVVLVGNISDDSEWLIFVRCVATALVAAVIAQFIFAPNGALSALPLVVRLGAALAGFGAFLLFGRRMIVGIVTGEVLMLASYTWYVSSAV